MEMEIAQPAELRLKEWLYLESVKHGLTTDSILMALHRNRYNGIRLRRQNGRVVFVQLPAPEITRQNASMVPVGAIPIGTWIKAEMASAGISYHGVWTRLARGKYPHIERLRVGTKKRANYVRLPA